ncbi:MAG: alpha/beta hydrolase [Anaerolineae bacterium]|nr:alpha/beta hydrolase [Anaerolineae bacterium]
MKYRAFALLVIVLLLLMAGLAQAQDDNPVVLSELSAPTASGLLPVNDIQMYYAQYGEEGQPLILLHGGLGNADYFANQIQAFVNAGFQVFAFDSRGHGRSSVTDTPIGYALMASDVLAAMDALGIDKADLVGWSDGGIIGLDIAINHPERLNKLVAYGANYIPAGVNPAVGESAVFNAYVEQALTDYALLNPAPENMDAFLANISNMWATEPNFSEEQMRGITVPTLILDGWQEEAIFPQHDFDMAALIPNGELTLMPGVGHFAMFLTPEMFNSIVLNYLGR